MLKILKNLNGKHQQMISKTLISKLWKINNTKLSDNLYTNNTEYKKYHKYKEF